MKQALVPSLIALTAALAGNCLAVTPVSEDFSADSLDASRWYQTRFGHGILRQAGGHLNFVTRAKPTKDDYAVIELLTSQPGYDENWEVVVDLTDKTDLGYDAGCGIMIVNSQERNDYLFLDFYGKGMMKNGKLVAGGVSAGVLVDGKHSKDSRFTKNPKVSKGAVRFRFNATTKLMTLSVSPTQKAEGYTWLKIGTFSPAGKGGDVNGNWKMKDGTSRFAIQLYGFANAKEITAGKVWLDNFSVAAP